MHIPVGARSACTTDFNCEGPQTLMSTSVQSKLGMPFVGPCIAAAAVGTRVALDVRAGAVLVGSMIDCRTPRLQMIIAGGYAPGVVDDQRIGEDGAGGGAGDP